MKTKKLNFRFEALDFFKFESMFVFQFNNLFCWITIQNDYSISRLLQIFNGTHSLYRIITINYD